jgi:uncharacterized protein (DUF169 family)
LEAIVKPLKTDLSIFHKFNFSNKPVGVKYCLGKPAGIDRLEGSFPICEMIKVVNEKESPFYIAADNENCFGKLPLGWIDAPPFAEAGYGGEEMEIFQEARANGRISRYAPRFPRGWVNYVAFSTFDKLTFDPDLLILLATPGQAEIILRAMTYVSGELLESVTANVLACAWLFVYPYQTGKVNYMFTGLGFGMKARQIFTEGQVLISIPYDRILTITENLKEMKWVLPAYEDGKDKFPFRAQAVNEKLAKIYTNP